MYLYLHVSNFFSTTFKGHREYSIVNMAIQLHSYLVSFCYRSSRHHNRTGMLESLYLETNMIP